MIDNRDFRRTMGRFATGITVVTMRSEARCHGITVNAFMSVSLEPPLIAVSIDKRARAHPTLLESERFGVSILRAGQEDLSDHFAGRRIHGIADPFVEFHGFPVVRDTLGDMVCSVRDIVEAGDHSIFLGEVLALRADDGRPLLYYEGDYIAARDLDVTE